MSFILDALKKSESDRQRQSGPALYEVKVAPPRAGLPPWAIAIVILLGVNLAIGVWMLLRRPATPAVAPAATATLAPAGAPATPAAPAPPLAAAAAQPGAAAGATSAPAAAPSASGAAAANPAPGAPAAAVSPDAAPGALTAEDYAPAAEAPGAPSLGRVRRGTAAGVPLYQDAAATPGTNIPQLRLDLHVYAARPQERFVMINMHKLHEGDLTPEGVRVDGITPEGALLSYHGSSFLLPRE